MNFRRSVLRACIVWSLASVPAFARDAFVLFSGGGTPLTNNSSQYLQARAMSAFLLGRYPADSVWIFFGAGNREGEPPIFSDVRRQVKKDGLLLESWVPGVLPQNRRADKATFLGALRQEVLPAVRDGGTLYLFVGDHGTQQKDGGRESLITLWQMKPTPPRGWRSDPTEELSVSELRAVLEEGEGLGEGRVVFCMTQCHSGGFHFLGLQRELLPESDWFDGFVPDWATPVERAPLPSVAGFTATDESSLAAGCDPDPDPDRWAGYERFVPEALLGTDLFSGARAREGLASFAAAHDAATLVDQTIDKPRSTAEQYLERWAALIERLDGEKNVTAAIRTQIDAYRRTVDAGLAEGTGESFTVRRGQFAAFIRRMIEQNKTLADLIEPGDRAALERAIGPGEGRPTPPGSRPVSPLAKEWQEVVRPAWKAAVEAGDVSGLTGFALAFEKYLLVQEDRGRDLMFARGWQNPLLNDIYWQSGSAIPAEKDPVKAEAVARWAAERRAKIAAWAAGSPDEKVKATGERMKPRAPNFGRPRALSPRIAAERTLFYRRTLAAWAFLQAVGHRAALAELDRLIALESQPLPSGRQTTTP